LFPQTVKKYIVAHVYLDNNKNVERLRSIANRMCDVSAPWLKGWCGLWLVQLAWTCGGGCGAREAKNETNTSQARAKPRSGPRGSSGVVSPPVSTSC